MPTWLQIFVTVLSIVATILATIGFTSYWNERMKHKATRKNKKEDEEEAKREAEEKAKEAALEELKHQKYLSELRSIIKEENELSVAPIRTDVSKIQSQVQILADGTTDMLRERILSTYYKCMEKGYRTQYDYENIEHMHKDYVGLGGNSFVASCVKSIKELPSEEEYKSKHKQGRKPKTKKQILVENK